MLSLSVTWYIVTSRLATYNTECLMSCKLVQAESAFGSAGGAKEGHLDIPALRVAMVMVLGRAVKESEAEHHLHGLRKRTFPQQPRVRAVGDKFGTDATDTSESYLASRNRAVKSFYTFVSSAGFHIEQLLRLKLRTTLSLSSISSTMTVLQPALSSSLPKQILLPFLCPLFQASQHDLFHILLGIRASPPSSPAEAKANSPLRPGPLDATTLLEASRGCTNTPGYDGELDRPESLKGDDKLDHLTPAAVSSNATPPSAVISTRLKPPPRPKSFWETSVGRSLDSSPAARWANNDVVNHAGLPGNGVSNSPTTEVAVTEGHDDPPPPFLGVAGTSSVVPATQEGQERHAEEKRGSRSLEDLYEEESQEHTNESSAKQPLEIISGVLAEAGAVVEAGNQVEEHQANVAVGENHTNCAGGDDTGAALDRILAQGAGTKAVRSLSKGARASFEGEDRHSDTGETESEGVLKSSGETLE